MKTKFFALPYSIALKAFEGAKGIIITENDAGEESIVAQFFDNYLDNVNRIHRHAEMFIRLPQMLALLNRAVNEWPAFDGNGEVKGADLVDWFASFRLDAKVLLAEAECAIVDSDTHAGIQALQHAGETDETSVLPVPNRHARSAIAIADVSCKCDNCGHICDQSNLKPAKGLEQRLEHPAGHPNRIMPAGECPECGSLAYAVEKPTLPVLFVNVRCLLATPSDPEDVLVEGRYRVTFDPEAVGFSMEKLASVALDVFHDKWGINELDNFEISVLDQNDQPIDQDLHHVNGTGSAFAVVDKVGDVPFRSALEQAADGGPAEFFPSTAQEGIGSVMMPDMVGEYDVPSQVPEWGWVEQQASFSHNRNGQDGIWEFVLNLSRTFDSIPEKLKPVLAEAKSKNLSYLVFHQGT